MHEQQRLFAPISSTETFEKKDVNTIMTIYNNDVTIRKHHYDHIMHPKIFVSLMTKKYEKRDRHRHWRELHRDHDQKLVFAPKVNMLIME